MGELWGQNKRRMKLERQNARWQIMFPFLHLRKVLPHRLSNINDTNSELNNLGLKQEWWRHSIIPVVVKKKEPTPSPGRQVPKNDRKYRPVQNKGSSQRTLSLLSLSYAERNFQVQRLKSKGTLFIKFRMEAVEKYNDKVTVMCW